MSGSSELGLMAVIGIMVIAVLGQRNQSRPLRGRTARVVSGALLTIAAVATLGTLVIVAFVVASPH